MLCRGRSQSATVGSGRRSFVVRSSSGSNRIGVISAEIKFKSLRMNEILRDHETFNRFIVNSRRSFLVSTTFRFMQHVRGDTPNRIHSFRCLPALLVEPEPIPLVRNLAKSTCFAGILVSKHAYPRVLLLDLPR